MEHVLGRARALRYRGGAGERHRSPARGPPAKRGKFSLPTQTEFDEHNRLAAQNGWDQWHLDARATAAFVTKLVKQYDLFAMGPGDGFHTSERLHAWHVGSEEGRTKWSVQDWVEKLTQWKLVYSLYGGSLDGAATRGKAGEAVQPDERAPSPHPGGPVPTERPPRLLIVGMTHTQAVDRLPAALAEPLRNHALHVMDPNAEEGAFATPCGRTIQSFRAGIGMPGAVEGRFDVIILDWRVLIWLDLMQMGTFFSEHLEEGGKLYMRDLAERPTPSDDCEFVDIGSPESITIKDEFMTAVHLPSRAVSARSARTAAQILDCMGYGVHEAALVHGSTRREIPPTATMQSISDDVVIVMSRPMHYTSPGLAFLSLRRFGFQCELVEEYPLAHAMDARGHVGAAVCVRPQRRRPASAEGS